MNNRRFTGTTVLILSPLTICSAEVACGSLHFATRALSQLTNFRYQHILRSRREESLGCIESAAFVTAFLEHASGWKISKDIVAVGGQPKLKRAYRLFNQWHIIHDHLAG